MAFTKRPNIAGQRPAFQLAGFALAWIAGIALAAMSGSPPQPSPASALAHSFSAERAMADVEAIAARPHPTGSPEIELVRRRLVARMQALGLSPQRRASVGVTENKHFPDLAIAGRVQNIVGELPGTDPTLPAVLVMAHYDSARHSPGAGDDAAGIAAALEIARALKADEPHRRTVIFLFTDGEEPGLLGSSAFFQVDPSRKRVGVVVNLEARGDSGRTAMFQTSAQGGGLVAMLQKHARAPSADSFASWLYERMPNDTDLTSAFKSGLPGMNFAFAGHQIAYHTPISTPERLNRGSLQHMGDQVLPVVRAMADAPALPVSAPDRVYSDVFGLKLVSYPPWGGWMLAIGLAAAALMLAALAVRRDLATPGQLVSGAGVLLALLFVAALALRLDGRLLTALLGAGASPHALIGQFELLLGGGVLLLSGIGLLVLPAAANGWWRAAAYAFLAVGLICSLLGGIDPPGAGMAISGALLCAAVLRRPNTLWGLWTGGLLLAAALALCLQFAVPKGAHLLTWPLLAMVAACAIAMTKPLAGRPALELLAIGALGALAFGLLASQAYGFFTATGPVAPLVLTPFATLAALALLPLVWRWDGAPVGGSILLVAGMGLLAVAGVRGSRPSPQAPHMVEAFYVADLDKGRAWRASASPDLGAWTSAALSLDGDFPRRGRLEPFLSEPLWLAAARPVAFAAPPITLETSGEALLLRTRAVNQGRFMRLMLKPSAEMKGLSIGGLPVRAALPAGVWSQVTFHAPAEGDVVLELPKPAGAGVLEIWVAEVRDGWPKGREPAPRPSGVEPFRRADTTWIVTRRKFDWK